nr:hypothetical protein [Tanacetum cinerariifolium]
MKKTSTIDIADLQIAGTQAQLVEPLKKANNWERMESGCGKTRMNVQGDRLSNLPDDLIHKILSFVGINLAVQTSALSSRWSSQSFEHLTFAGFSYMNCAIFTSTWELTSLTTLHFESIAFNDEVTANGIFSKCVNLKKLVLKDCDMTRSNGVDICHPGLCDLTLENGRNFENVVAPQLKNLTVRYWRGLHLISAPKLVSLQFEDSLYEPNKPDAHTVFDLLHQRHSVKYLTLGNFSASFSTNGTNLISTFSVC